MIDWLKQWCYKRRLQKWFRENAHKDPLTRMPFPFSRKQKKLIAKLASSLEKNQK